ncbi:MAG: hypothetical protein U1C96_07985 [Gallionella sp.]|jgi:hypothetical protein|nr:hypothetical protein [Gallionella sp.]
MSETIQEQLDKLRYQLRLLAETIDHREYPIPALVLELDWDDKDLNRAHDIFEKYDAKLEASEEINWGAFEMELRDTFSIGYQTVKSIVLAFFDNSQWQSVCTAYAKKYECVEFHRITRPKDDL